VRTKLAFQAIQLRFIENVLDDNAAVPLKYFVYHADIFVHPNLLNLRHRVSPR